jgi:hypothetical protein
MKRLLHSWQPIIDLLTSLAVYPAGLVLRFVRRIGVDRLPACRRALLRTGVFPIQDHYYEPLFDPRKLRHSLELERSLPGIDWNIDGQLQLLSSFSFEEELACIPTANRAAGDYFIDNQAFGRGDADFLYQLIRLKKPMRMVEVGSGYSTLMARRAIAKNAEDDPQYSCQHACIEPYEMPWLEGTGASIIRDRVEDADKSLFTDLCRGDILFIDSSHVIRPQGDVLCEYLQILPRLAEGVIVHVHDIFSPRDYPTSWIVDKVRFWNEQYLLEAFLSHNCDWKIVGALNYLRHNNFEQLQEKCPFLSDDSEPGSFYIERASRPSP